MPSSHFGFNNNQQSLHNLKGKNSLSTGTEQPLGTHGEFSSSTNPFSKSTFLKKKNSYLKYFCNLK